MKLAYYHPPTLLHHTAAQPPPSTDGCRCHPPQSVGQPEFWKSERFSDLLLNDSAKIRKIMFKMLNGTDREKVLYSKELLEAVEME